MRTTRIFLAATAAGALAFGLVGCSGGGGLGGGALTWEDSPLNDYMSAGYDPDMSDEEREAQWAQDDKERQEIIAQCMTDEGFEYKPVDYSGSYSSGSDVEWEPDKREWVEKYGYGMFNSPWNEIEQPEPEEMEEFVDPNMEYVESLSASEQTAYYEVLYGEQQEETIDEETGEAIYEYNWEEAGCQGKADHEVGGASQDLYTDYEDLMTEIEKLYTEIEESSEVAELNTKWSECIAEEGFEFDSPMLAQTSVSDQMNEYYENLPADYWENGGEDPSTSDEWKEMGKDEIKLALADLDCREKFNYNDEKLKLQFELEEQFIKDHKAELDEFKTAAEQSMKG